MNRITAFEAGFASYVPEATDPPENVPFYCTWRGLQAAWGTDFVDRFNSAVHRAACYASDAIKNPHTTRQGKTPYSIALETLLEMVKDAKLPRDPYHRGFYGYMPTEPTEQDARAEFNRQFKIKFPGKRANSKEANAKYADVANKAMAIVRAEYQSRLAAHEAVEAKIEAENAKRKQEWLDAVYAMASFEDAVRSLQA